MKMMDAVVFWATQEKTIKHGNLELEIFMVTIHQLQSVPK
jgi:hypothetical protein